VTNLQRVICAFILACCCWSGCNIEMMLFPVFQPELLDPPPVAPGSFAVNERRIEFDDLGDGMSGGITIFEPEDADGARPAMVWLLGVNNRAHYHQSLHEHLASFGYVVAVPDTRDISFADTEYHQRNTLNGNRTFDRLVAGELGIDVDAARVALGGYSAGGSLAAFAAARAPATAALVMWAPAPAPIWQGLDPNELLPQVTASTLFLLAELDDVTPANEWPAEMMMRMSAAEQSTQTIDGGVHLFLQQPSGVDDRSPPTSITRREQMSVAIEATRVFLDERL